MANHVLDFISSHLTPDSGREDIDQIKGAGGVVQVAGRDARRGGRGFLFSRSCLGGEL